MNGHTHLMIGISAGILGAAHTPDDTLLRVAVVAVAGVMSLLPDIDHPKAIISGYTPGVGHATRLFVSHRGGTHTVLFAAAIMALMLLAGLPIPITAAAGVGIVSHLVADMLTPQGVPLLIPVSRRAFRAAPYPVLKMTAWALEPFALVGSLAVIGLTLWGKI